MNHLLIEAQKALDRTEDTLKEARTLLESDLPLGAANRVYYGVYYCMSALLIIEDVFPKTHHGVQAKFSELYIKSGRLPGELSAWAIRAAELRQSADYDLSADLSEEEIRDALLNAMEFHNLTKCYISKFIANSYE